MSMRYIHGYMNGKWVAPTSSPKSQPYRSSVVSLSGAPHPGLWEPRHDLHGTKACSLEPPRLL